MFPEGVSTCTVRYGRELAATGAAGVLSELTVRTDRLIVHEASGVSLWPAPVDLTVDLDEQTVVFAVPHVDQPGFIDPATGADLNGWSYVLVGRLSLSGRPRMVFQRRFRVFTGETDVDLDTRPPDGPDRDPTHPGFYLLGGAHLAADPDHSGFYRLATT